MNPKKSFDMPYKELAPALILYVPILLLVKNLPLTEESQTARSFLQNVQLLTHKITKSSIDTKTVQRINSYFIDGASQKHFDYIFENKSSFFFI